MSIKDFLRAPRMECGLSPTAVAQEAFAAGPITPTKQWEVVNTARTDARKGKWIMALATGLVLYGATTVADESKPMAGVLGLMAAGAACMSNDYRRLQKAHAAALNTGALQQITTKKINWHLSV